MTNPSRIALRNALRIGALFAVFAALAAPRYATAQEFRALDGHVVDGADLVPGFSSGLISIRLSAATTESELAGYAALARKEGETALYNHLSSADLGRFRLAGEVGRPIAIVQETREDGFRRLLLVIERRIAPREIFGSSQTVRYPYLVIDATLDADGYGFADLHPLAQLRISPDGKLSYRSFLSQPMRIPELRAS